MSVLFIRCFALLLSWPPLKINHAIGAGIGKLFWITNSSQRKITEENLRLCFPEMSASERHTLARNSLIETGKQITECAWIWHRPIEQIKNRIIDIPGEHHLNAAIESGKGVIVISPHIGNWELCSLPLSRSSPMTYLYRSPRKTGMDRVLVHWRAHLGGEPAPLNSAGIKGALKVLKSGRTLGILPDQEPDLDKGVFAPFFNQPALTMTLLPRLANRSGSIVLFCVAERLPDAQGWRFHVIPADSAISSANVEDATAAVNKGVERCIELCPEQYLWDYKRFNTHEDGTRRRYK